ncbi:hypothetical protein [Gluconacetobacter takamatsuzukensis]|uniref:Uncharacterized protein n=1 Tax=Gluconacetobacter takamatsuzukensis TaxID=1286190 RepID=A0A7W4KBE0_9PROT|nr:hypothetical protein [Gluconacetobacter takamatsuzukensis]MBB2203811.1 hypothetical protein [Gluconacetobacter takamatsuzukensis]
MTEKSIIDTFDVFDTLIGRRCVMPLEIFSLVEKKTGVAGFAKARRAAELNLIGRPYTFDDIYDELARIFDPAKENLQLLKTAEVEEELENVIPISENIQKVNNGDVLISDMYLSEGMIRSLLTKAGLEKEVSLIVTNYGKHDGYIWKEILSNFSIRKHLGDNVHADGLRAAEAGIPFEITTSSQINAFEKVFFDIGFRSLGELCREARLATWNNMAHERDLQTTQIHMNFPILFFSSIILCRLCRQLGKTRILFSSRDCWAWKIVFESMFPNEFECIYYYTSRYAKISNSDSYQKYSSRLITDQSMVVDLCGSGWSLEKISDNIQADKIDILYMHKMPKDRKYMEGKNSDKCKFYCIIENENEKYRNHLLEIANYIDHGMLKDIKFVNDIPCPIFFSDTRSENEMLYIDIQKKALNECISRIGNYDFSDVVRHDNSIYVQIIQILYRTLSNNVSVHNLYAQNFFAENAAVETILKKTTESVAMNYSVS